MSATLAVGEFEAEMDQIDRDLAESFAEMVKQAEEFGAILQELSEMVLERLRQMMAAAARTRQQRSYYGPAIGILRYAWPQRMMNPRSGRYG